MESETPAPLCPLFQDDDGDNVCNDVDNCPSNA